MELTEHQFLLHLLDQHTRVMVDPEWEWDAMVEAAHDIADSIRDRITQLEAITTTHTGPDLSPQYSAVLTSGAGTTHNTLRDALAKHDKDVERYGPAEDHPPTGPELDHGMGLTPGTPDPRPLGVYHHHRTPSQLMAPDGPPPPCCTPTPRKGTPHGNHLPSTPGPQTRHRPPGGPHD